MNSKRRNWFQLIFSNKCPACHQGEFFIHKHGYRVKDMSTVHEHCGSCGQRFEPEPGFFFGAAYVSYALNVALMVACAVAVYVLVADPEPLDYLIPIIVSSLILFPAILRLSRIIWASMFIPFGGEKKRGAQSKIVQDKD